eukprot:987547-Ditylum_brightwellii.AAC.1
MSCKKGISKVTMSNTVYKPANDKAISLTGCACMTFDIITSDDNEDEPFVKTLQLCLNNLRATNEKKYYVTHPDEDTNAILIKRQHKLK